MNAIRARLNTELVPATLGAIYFGILGQERNALLSDYDLLLMGAAGEGPNLGEHPSSTECKVMHVRFELYVRCLDPDDAESTVIEKWGTLQDALYNPDYRRVENPPGTILAETIGQWFGVEDGYTGGEDMPLWRTRGGTVDYRVAVERFGYHPY